MSIPAMDNPLSGGNNGQSKSPDPMTVRMFHLYDDVDTDQGAHHHTLGAGNNQASPGSHVHNGSDSPLLLEGTTLSGSKGGNAALASVISALVQLGATDSTTA
jgi:hypothetical protein